MQSEAEAIKGRPLGRKPNGQALARYRLRALTKGKMTSHDTHYVFVEQA